MVLNKSTNIMETKMVTKPKEQMELKSNCIKVGAILGMLIPLEKSGSTLNIP